MKTILYITILIASSTLFLSCKKQVKPSFLEGKWKVVALNDADNSANNLQSADFAENPMTFEFHIEANKYNQNEVFVYKNGEMTVCYYEILNDTAIDMSDDERGREARAMLINKINNKSFELRKAQNGQVLTLVRQ